MPAPGWSVCANRLKTAGHGSPANTEFKTRTARVGETRARDGRMLLMLDATLLAAGIGFFVIAVLYVAACDRL